MQPIQIFLYFLLAFVAVRPVQAAVPATTQSTSNQPRGVMESATEFAGMFAAHAVWCVSDGETLIPLLAYDTGDGKPEMIRLVADHIEQGVAQGKEMLTKNTKKAKYAVLVFDGFITLKTGKIDALIVTIRDYSGGEAQITMAVPYRPAKDPKGFAVFRPKFLEFKGSEPDWKKVGSALWTGIDKHEKGAEVWNKHLDQTQ